MAGFSLDPIRTLVLDKFSIIRIYNLNFSRPFIGTQNPYNYNPIVSLLRANQNWRLIILLKRRNSLKQRNKPIEIRTTFYKLFLNFFVLCVLAFLSQ